MAERYKNEKMTIWLLPVAVVFSQLLPREWTIGIAVILLLASAMIKPARKLFLLLGITVAGHLLWVALSHWIESAMLNSFLAKAFGRFGLAGYIVLFMAWNAIAKTENNFFRLGNSKAVIRFPFIWAGKREPIWRFVLIFCGLCFISMIAAVIISPPKMDIFLYGLLFTIINAILEENIWRGFVLTRAIDLSGEKMALAATSLAFGLYHISLGFPLWACLVFAVGGYYMGGYAVISKGLLAPIIMHLFVNMIFVLCGVIF